MPEFIMGLFFIILGLLVWAAVGHGIWLVVRSLYLALVGTRCQQCGRKSVGERCPHCTQGRGSPASGTPSVQDDLVAAERLLAFSRFKRYLDEQNHASLAQLLHSLKKQVRGEAQFRDVQQPAEAHRPSTVALPEKQPLPPSATTSAVVQPKRIPSATEALATGEMSARTPPPHPLDADDLPAVVTPRQRTPVGQRITAGLLKSFMEQSNIRWIELISAALIVVCSVGLVISLWSTLSSTSRFFPSLVFLLATAGVHGAGQYTLRRWKLQSTSRGILHIGLMLIPLAVMVGILLARRDGGSPTLDPLALAVVTLGTLVYGGLAVTASRSLFSHRWSVVAAATIVSSVTLIPIHYLGQGVQSVLLLPLVGITMWAALQASLTSLRHRKIPPRIAKRMIGTLVQCGFAIGAAGVFWVLNAREQADLSVGWWIAVGLFAAAWIGWGWTISLPPQTIPSRRLAPLAIGGWCVASLGCALLLLACWQLASIRLALSGLLVLLAVWWLLHGLCCRLQISLIAGALALLGGCAIGGEGLWTPIAAVQASDWISFSRTISLSTVGLLSILLSGGTLLLAGTSVQRLSVAPPRPSSRRAPNSVMRIGGDRLRLEIFSNLQVPFLIAGAVALSAAAGLTLLASLVPWGETPYGGNWAALMLMAYGLLTSLAAIGVASRPVGNGTLYQGLSAGIMPVGQALLLLAVVRLCQTSPVLESSLGWLRPYRAWGVGVAGLAVFWSLAAAGLRKLQRSTVNQNQNIAWLCGGAVAMAISSLPALWLAGDQLFLVARLGWYLPLTYVAVFYAWRQSAWRELTYLLLYGWLAVLLFDVGASRDWWHTVGRTGSSAAFVTLLVTVTLAFESCINWLAKLAHSPLRSDGGDAATKNYQRESSWINAGPSWAAAVMIVAGWLLLWSSLFPVAINHLMACLDAARNVLDIGADGSALSDRPVLTWYVLTGLGLAATAWWLGSRRHPRWLISLLAGVPLWTAFTMAGFVAPPFSLTTALWVLALWILASEFMPLFGRQPASVSAQAWQQLVTWNEPPTPSQLWLALARGLAMGFLLVGSAAFVVSVCSGYLPVELRGDASLSWFGNLRSVLFSLGPALSVVLIRWIIAVANGESPKMIVGSGLVTAVLTAANVALIRPPAWESTAVVFLQVAALVASLLAWMTLGFATARNYLGLRKLTGGKSSLRQLLPKSMKGQRWKQAEHASWQLIRLAFATVAALGLGAAIAVAVFPAVHWPSVQWLGGWLAVLAFLATVPLFSYLVHRRGASRFGLLAIGLGLAAPLAAVSYADWLLSRSPVSPVAQNFEPYRLMMLLWLMALAIGVAVRFVANFATSPDAGGRPQVKQSDFSWLGESAWVALAAVVGLLGLVATTQDPNSRWPLAELSGLACIAALSGVVRGQAWRGHAAAVLAAAGLWAWLLRQPGVDRLESLWLVLWGPLWVAALALGLRLAMSRWIGLTSNANNANPYAELGDSRRRLFTVDQTVSLHIPIASAMFSFLWILLQAPQLPSQQTWWVLGLTAACLLVALARLWDPRPGKRGLSVYLNLLAVSMVTSLVFSAVAELPRLHTWLLWLASGLGAMAIMAGLLRELIRESSRLGAALHLGSIAAPSKLRHALMWMPAFHTLAALLALLPSVLLVLALEERTLRVAATVLPFVGALAILPLASQRDKAIFRYCGLLLISSSLVLLWWADLPSAWASAGQLEAWSYLQRAFAALIAIAIVYPALVTWPSLRGDWERPLMVSGWLALGLGVASGLAMLLLQLAFGWEMQAAAAPLGTKLLTLIAWVAIVARLLQFAARPHGLDGAASVGLRQAAVYAAQIGLALLCAAAYFHFPNLFGGVLAAWWPLIMFAIAMTSAGLGQWLHRLGETIIADPVRQSSLLLPLIPLAGVWWVQPEGTQWLWRDWDRYSVLLLTAAGLYGVQGWVRQSVELRILSAGLLLLSFWSFLHSQPNLQFLQHPQFWLLPPALGTLAFVEINRRRLDETVLVAVRYGAIMVAYLSSTAEIFLKAFEGQLWQPLLLLVLALAGVAAGMFLRVRAFLYCGIAFSAVALVGMVWHAQQAIGQVWPWWAFGIATGISLIVVLGYFEKNRPRVVAYLEQLKQWE